MLEILTQIDQAITITINHFHNATADAFMTAVSGRLTWLPLYLGLLLLFNKIFGWQKTLLIIGAIVLNLTLTDQISVFFKDYFMRSRPCHNPDIAHLLHLPDGCGGKFGFVSSHAANTMGLAVLVSMILKQRLMVLAMFSYALLNGYSRIYLGKHFVGDVIFGFLLGVVLAFGVYALLRLIISRIKWK